MRWSDQALGIVDSERKITTAQEQHSTKNQYFLSPEHQNSIFSVPGKPKLDIFCFRSTKNQYFLSQEHMSTKNQYFLFPEHQKSIFSIPGARKINIFCPRITKNQYFLSPEHQKSIFPRASDLSLFGRAKRSLSRIPSVLSRIPSALTFFLCFFIDCTTIFKIHAEK